MPNTGQKRAGKCLCGGVRYEVAEPLEPILQCHCENCRRVSGNFVAAARADSASLDVVDSDGTLDWFDLDYARYGFCQRCGSTLFYQASDRLHLTSIMVGTLDDASGLMLNGIWFADEAQSHNTLPPDVPHYRGNA